MRLIKSDRQNDFLNERGIKPQFELYGYALYDETEELKNALESYFIMYSCFPNRGW